MAKDDVDFGSRAKPVKDRAIPAVYLFQPAYFIVVENEELEQWRRHLAEKVGLKRDRITALRPAQGTYSLCGSTAFSEACDCDEI